MHLDSCRELKRSLLSRASTLTAGTGVPWLGLGITYAGPQEGAALAVRVRDTDSASDLLARLSEEARDEIDVLAVGEIRALGRFDPEELQKRHRPLVPGSSVGHPDVTAGTIGAFVTVNDVPHVLSNNHVLGNSGEAQVGDGALQPGTADGGADPRDRIGRLAAMSKLSTDQPNIIDAAIATIDDGIGHDASAYPGGALTGVVQGPPEDVEVQKVGRTTGHTDGRITAFEVDGLRISFPTGELVFDDQIEITGGTEGFSDGGDSGSLIFTSARRAAVGLLFAGSQSGGPDGTGLTYANPIGPVLEEFGARLVGTEAG